MRKLPALTRKRDIFARKYIITVPSWGPWVIAGAIAIAIVIAAKVITTAICLVVTILSLIFCRIAWNNLKEMRYALHNAINDIENADEDVLEDKEAA